MRSARTVFFCRNYRRCTSLSPQANRRPSWSRPCNTETSHIGSRKHSLTKVCQVSFCSGAISYPASCPFSHGLTTVQRHSMRPIVETLNHLDSIQQSSQPYKPSPTTRATLHTCLCYP